MPLFHYLTQTIANELYFGFADGNKMKYNFFFNHQKTFIIQAVLP